MDLAAYLDRVGFAGPLTPDLDTLVRLHRAHLHAIPYENLDVQLGRPLRVDAAAAFEKLVVRGRGGWCYEMNGLFAAMLELIGFRVTRMAGAVMRDILGDAQIGNHLVLLVHLDEGDILADVGFGDGMIEPAPLRAGPFQQDFLAFRLEALPDGWWRFHNHADGGAPSFDFRPEPAESAVFNVRCAWLQADPASPFVQNAVVQRFQPGRQLSLRGKVLKTLTKDGAARREIEDAADYVGTLRDTFGLDLPQAATLWPRILTRHAELIG